MVVVWWAQTGKSFVGLQTFDDSYFSCVICWLFCITGFLIFFSISTSEHFVAFWSGLALFGFHQGDILYDLYR